MNWSLVKWGLVFSLAQSVEAFAQETANPANDGSSQETPYPTEQWGEYLDPEVGTIVIPRADVELVDNLPEGVLFRRGSVVGTAESNTKFEVVDTATVPSFFGEHHYLKVVPTEEGTEGCESGCWVYQGRFGAQLPENLLPPEVAPVASTRDGGD